MSVEPIQYESAAIRRTRARTGLMESYFVKLNSPDGNRALWIRWTLICDRGGKTRAEQWIIAFHRGHEHVAIKRSYPLDAQSMFRSDGTIAYPTASFDGLHAKGFVEKHDHRVEFDLRLLRRIGPLRQFPHEWLYTGPFPEQKATSPVPDAIVDGFYTVDGERIDATGWRAMHGHNWGVRSTHRYVWTHASGFDEADDVVFEAASGRPRKGGIELPWMSLAFVFYRGQWIRFDSLTRAVRAPCSVSIMRWECVLENGTYTLRAIAHCSSDLAVGLHYWNPAGGTTYCLNSKLADLEIQLDGPGMKHTMRTRRAALEIGWPSADHGIAMRA